MSSLEACKIYAHGAIMEALVTYNVAEYQEELRRTVNDICLKMGHDCLGQKAKFNRLTDQLTRNIYSITKDEAERDRLFNYANRIIELGRNFS